MNLTYVIRRAKNNKNILLFYYWLSRVVIILFRIANFSGADLNIKTKWILKYGIMYVLDSV